MAKFIRIAEVFEQIEKLSSRNEMTDILASLFEEFDPEEVQILCYLIKGRVAPLFVPAEFNMSER